MLAAYLSVKTWKKNADFVVIGRAVLERWLKLERFKNERLRWMEQDIAPWFPYQKPLVFKAGQFASLYFSRFDLDRYWVNGSMDDKDRIRLIKDKGLTGYAIPTNSKLDETKIVTELAKISAGLSDLSFF